MRPGDIVLDCGAHAGVFARQALALGAARVVAIEPEPLLAECLRRNFRAEIEVGKVEVAPLAVWSSPGSMTLENEAHNSGMSALVPAIRGMESVTVKVTTIDLLVAELGLPRVDYIKMDIEGAEREALRGAAAVLAKFRPRIMLDVYHRPDDMRVLPEVIRQANPAYGMSCGPCVSTGRQIIPHVAFFY